MSAALFDDRHEVLRLYHIVNSHLVSHFSSTSWLHETRVNQPDLVDYKKCSQKLKVLSQVKTHAIISSRFTKKMQRFVIMGKY